ncbi:MAG: MotA/TolQ/ExbB proton channel family protein [Verrucomicrobiota bacterium]|jgi:biopolymer transport protein ExbB|nr:MotA/TolQ/ExbB proton channel family protein [Verrucomicrobiota bacterium]
MNRIRNILAYMVIGGALLGPFAIATLAAVPPPAAGEESQPKKAKLSLWDLLKKGGYVMVPLAICSIAGLASSFERGLTLTRNRVIPGGFLDDVKTKLGTDGNTSAAIAFCEESASAAGRLIKAGLGKMERGVEHVEKSLEETGGQEIDRMKRSLKILGLVITIAPLLGLVGTVYGMIEAFQTTAAAEATTAKSAQLANGIYEALVTTATGLTIAIPIMVVHYMLNAKIDSFVDDFNQLGEGFLKICDQDPDHDATTAPDESEDSKPVLTE